MIRFAGSFRISLLSVFLAWLAPSAGFALTEFQKSTANDAGQNDNFGFAASISGNTAIFGAVHDRDSGYKAGAAYLFRNPGSGTWSQLDKIFASDASSGDNFGSSVAISGNTAVIGARYKGGLGSAYIFKDNGAGDWIQVDELTADDGAAGDEFGRSVAISGNTAIVGAWTKNLSRGAAYVFRDNGAGDWIQIGKLTATDTAIGDRFGGAVAISGPTAFVGADLNSNVAGAVNGAAYVFQESVGTWNQVDKLLPSDGSLSKQFGSSIALNGNTAVIGAVGDNAGGVSSGAAYIFNRPGAVWQQIDKLTASDAAPNDAFGYSVALDGSTAIVGAYQNNNGLGVDAGAAYLYKPNAIGNWNQVAKLAGSDQQAGDTLGFSVAISGNVALAGAPLSNSGATDAGAAYLYRPPTNFTPDFNQNGKVDAADYVLWRNSLGLTGVGLPADGNGDGVVNQADCMLWRENFGLTTPAGAGESLSAVPEPSSIVLLLTACLGLPPRRRT